MHSTKSAPPAGIAAPGTHHGVPVVAHVLLGAWVALMLVLARTAPTTYDALVQEDRVVEWWTVLLFLGAAALGGVRAVRGRRAFDLLVALFCLVVAGEEVSWGQRLVGFTPPDLFLANNTQQEANLHNFHGALGKPKWLLMAALAGYGLLLPAVAWMGGRAGAAGSSIEDPPTTRSRRVAAEPSSNPVAPAHSRAGLLDRLGATAPPALLAPWFALSVGLLAWYPVEFTGEWVEAMAGALFLLALPSQGRRAAAIAAGALAAALLLTTLGTRPVRADGATAARAECARTEVEALLADIVHGDAPTDRLLDAGRVHKRAWTMGEEGYLHLAAARQFAASRCAAENAAAGARRRRYAIDPWGTAYWVEASRPDDDGRRTIVVYSFGPNRRRDGAGAPGAADDDVAGHGVLGATR